MDVEHGVRRKRTPSSGRISPDHERRGRSNVVVAIVLLCSVFFFWRLTGPFTLASRDAALVRQSSLSMVDVDARRAMHLLETIENGLLRDIDGGAVGFGAQSGKLRLITNVASH